MSERNRVATGVFVVIFGLSMGPSVEAQNIQNRLVSQTGANMCTLSVPTINTQVRPKATGFRNEGTTNAFVICAFNSPPGGAGGGIGGGFSSVGIYLYSLDGLDHHLVSCTAVNSLADGEFYGYPTPQFVVRTQNVMAAEKFGTQFGWTAWDFGSEDELIPGSLNFSVTCNLPPQVGIKWGFANSFEDVGN